MDETKITVTVRGIEVTIDRRIFNDTRFAMWMQSIQRASQSGDTSGVDVFESFDYMRAVFGREQLDRILDALEVDGITPISESIAFFLESVMAAGEQGKN